MKLVFIHGSPATGKLTVAKELVSMVSGRLFDNHVSIDFARAIFDFGSPGFDRLVYQARLLALSAASESKAELLVMTYCYAHPVDLPEFETFEAIWCKNDGVVLPVYLHCSENDAMQRVADPDRKTRQKISTPEGLQKFNAAYSFAPVPRANVLALNTSLTSANECASIIVRHCGLTSKNFA